MPFNPYTDALRLIVDLVNQPPTSAENLAARARAAGIVVDMRVDGADWAATLALIDQWTQIVDTTDETTRAAALNELLADAATHPRLTNHTGTGWHLHYRDDDVPLAAVLRALVGVGTALHLTSRGMDRIARCALDDCRRVYADLSRTGRQRYCSARCANRDAVRRHRTRNAAASR